MGPENGGNGKNGNLSITELFGKISGQTRLLISKEMELAKTELKADLKKEAVMAGGFTAALSGLFLTASMLFVTVILALSEVMPSWLAGLVVSAFLLLMSVIAALVGWSGRVKTPLARTQETLRDDFKLTKEKPA